MASTTSIRRLTVDDIPQALILSSQAGWNQTAQDWSTILELAPDSCFGLDCGGELVATATLLCYSERLAWLGMVLTKREFQRRGFARLLVQRALDEADNRAIRTVKLDATNQGQPLYERLGFVAEQDIERWSGSGLKSACDCADQPVAECLDWSATLKERHSLLELLARQGRHLGDGGEFVMHRAGLRARYLGPCIAHSEESAARLITSALAQDGGPWLWDLLPANPSAVALAGRLGFECERKLVRMSRGESVRDNALEIYAIAGFEFG